MSLSVTQTKTTIKIAGRRLPNAAVTRIAFRNRERDGEKRFVTPHASAKEQAAAAEPRRVGGSRVWWQGRLRGGGEDVLLEVRKNFKRCSPSDRTLAQSACSHAGCSDRSTADPSSSR